jgi:outer membrane protein OmpA-like peptidoglycan-associated protein
MKATRLCTILAITMALSACKTSGVNPGASSAPATGTAGCKNLGGTQAAGNTDKENAGIGALVGAVAGGLIGNASAKKSSVGVRNGLLLGALTGALAGSQYNNMIGKTEQADGSVKLDIPGAVMFRTGSSAVSTEFGATLGSVASTIREYCGVTALVVGHTDSTGTVDGNRRLSMDRAKATADYLASQGVDPSRVRQEGRGQDTPVASNADEAGRARNRRVEIFVQPPTP